MLKAIALREEHLEEAAVLVSNRYRRLREQESHLPHSYAEVTKLLPLLQNIFSASGVGVAAIRGDRLVGFLTGWQMVSFRGKRSIYSPEWANAADLEDSKRIYEEMYGHLAAAWVADRYVAHYISLFPNDVEALRAWHWMGFGMIAVDAICSLDTIQGHDANTQLQRSTNVHIWRKELHIRRKEIHIRRAELQDLEQVIELHEDLWEYHKGTPIFLLAEKKERSYYEEWLLNPDKVVWLAYWKEEPVAFMRLGPADDGVCTIIYDEKTTSIYGAFTKEEVRREGLATALLDHALKSALASGYERCAVSFEPMNLIGTRFWLKYFKPVCLTIVRHIDERVTQA